MQGSAEQCQAGRGKAGRGEAWYGLASTFLNVGVGVFGARYGVVLSGLLRCGTAGSGLARCHFQGE